MTTDTPSQNDNVVALAPLVRPISKPDQKGAEKKWGRAVIKRGFSVIPSMIFWFQGRLKLNSEELNLVLQLADHWWEADKNPFPSKATLAERMQMSPRNVQRIAARLEARGLIERIERHKGRKNQQANAYSLAGLVHQLEKLEEADRRETEKAKKATPKVKGGTR